MSDEQKKQDKQEKSKPEQKQQAKDQKQKKETKEDKIAELTDDIKRVQAEFENYKKRVEKENAQFCEYAKAEFVKKLLSVLDSFEMALKSTDNHEEFVKGVELIYSQLYTLLKDEGLAHIETKDRKLNPYLHEVMLSERSDKDEDTILEELQKGYTLKGRVLRHSKVKVAKK